MLGFTTGLRALTSASIALDVVGNNLANAATEGYSRQSAVFRSSYPFDLAGVGQLGTGADVTQIRRIADLILERRLLGQRHVFNRYDAQWERLREIEMHLAEPSENGLSARLSALFGGFGSLASSPDDVSMRQGVIQAGVSLASSFQEMRTALGSLHTALADQVETRIDQINSLAESVAELNVRIAQSEAKGTGANDLRDVRQRVLMEIAEQIDISTVELENGSVNVLVSGHLLVSADHVNALELEQRPDGTLQILAGSSDQQVIVPAGGALRGLLDVRSGRLATTLDAMDDLAHELIYEVNRRHSTGLPLDGGFRYLTSKLAVSDEDRDGDFLDEVLGEAGLPFEITEGKLTVTLTNLGTGEMTNTTLAIDPQSQTVGDLVETLSSVEHLTASVGATGQLRIQVDTGFTFDFAGRPDLNPDNDRTFGAASATLSSQVAGPFSLADGDVLSLAVDGGVAQEITFSADDFADITRATAEEVAAVINAQASGVVATASNGRLVVRSETSGVESQLQVADLNGSPAAELGLSTELEQGAVAAVSVEVTGRYAGGTEPPLTFRPIGEGEIGVAEELSVAVYDATGRRLGTVDVGAGYVPGEKLDIGFGLEVSFTAGSISEKAGDFFALELTEDSDSAGLLAAFQLNPFFTGTGAADIAVSNEIVADPSRLAVSLTGAEGDSANALRMAGVADVSLKALEGETLAGYWSRQVNAIGSEVQRTELLRETQESLLGNLERQREEISGVSVDEELVRLQEYQQLYEAAARFIQAVSEMVDTLMSL
ncbi:MAG: flagellar hook-associated protein FlgK [Planctomycetota bacterium]